jgi:glycerol uptake facilitator-like aquaporin
VNDFLIHKRKSTMKKQLIGALVGGLILFFWQFLSFGPLQIHAAQMDHLPQQEAILEALAANDVKEGNYFLPRMPLSASQEENHEFGMQNQGKPWARISYHHSLNYNFGMNMFRGFVIDFISVFMLIWMLLQFKKLDFKSTLMAALFIGFISYTTTHYLNSVWFEGNSIPDMIDAVVQWGLCGAWLGWWLNRRRLFGIDV